MFIPDIPKITDHVVSVLQDADVETKHAEEFVLESLSRKSRFFNLDLDSFGRKEIPVELTPQTLLTENEWLAQCLHQLNINIHHLKILDNTIYVVDDNRGLPLTKALAKRKDSMFTRGKTWFKLHPDGNIKRFRHDRPYVQTIRNADGIVIDEKYVTGTPNTDGIIAQIGDITNLKRKAVISINPGDFLRSALLGKYCAFTSCHNLRTGGTGYGSINYAMDSMHIMSYICDVKNSDQKIVGRSMVVVSNDMKTIGQRRFYPTPAIFGTGRASIVRAEIHKMLNPEVNTNMLRTVCKIYMGGTASMYIDNVEQWSTSLDQQPKDYLEYTPEVFCFKCGKIHRTRNRYCENCIQKELLCR